MGSSFDQATRAKLIALLDGLGSDSPFERARAGPMRTGCSSKPGSVGMT